MLLLLCYNSQFMKVSKLKAGLSIMNDLTDCDLVCLSACSAKEATAIWQPPMYKRYVCELVGGGWGKCDLSTFRKLCLGKQPFSNEPMTGWQIYQKRMLIFIFILLV